MLMHGVWKYTNRCLAQSFGVLWEQVVSEILSVAISVDFSCQVIFEPSQSPESFFFSVQLKRPTKKNHKIKKKGI